MYVGRSPGNLNPLSLFDVLAQQLEWPAVGLDVSEQTRPKCRKKERRTVAISAGDDRL